MVLKRHFSWFWPKTSKNLDLGFGKSANRGFSGLKSSVKNAFFAKRRGPPTKRENGTFWTPKQVKNVIFDGFGQKTSILT